LAASLDTIRTGKNYYLRNFGEEARFQVLEVLVKDDFRVKDLSTLEVFLLSDLIKYGKGDDYDFYEIEVSE